MRCNALRLTWNATLYRANWCRPPRRQETIHGYTATITGVNQVQRVPIVVDCCSGRQRVRSRYRPSSQSRRRGVCFARIRVERSLKTAAHRSLINVPSCNLLRQSAPWSTQPLGSHFVFRNGKVIERHALSEQTDDAVGDQDELRELTRHGGGGGGRGEGGGAARDNGGRGARLVNETDQYKWTALLCACDQGQTDVVDLLLERNADPGLANIMGFTPILVTAASGVGL